jgi:hypothetical protein
MAVLINYILTVILVNSIACTPISNTVDCIVGAMNKILVAPFVPLHYFDGRYGWRIWNVALSSLKFAI